MFQEAPAGGWVAGGEVWGRGLDGVVEGECPWPLRARACCSLLSIDSKSPGLGCVQPGGAWGSGSADGLCRALMALEVGGSLGRQGFNERLVGREF